ncbi:MAG: hypothetical protein Q9169_006166 [Polycauliona sp. 2 TL-2023]
MSSPTTFVCILVTLLCLVLQIISYLVLWRASRDVIQLLRDNNRILQEEPQQPPQIDFPDFKPPTEDGEYTEYSRWTRSHGGKCRNYYALNFDGRKDGKSPIPRSLQVDQITRDEEGLDGSAHNRRMTEGTVANIPSQFEANVVREQLPSRDAQSRKIAKRNAHFGTGFGPNYTGDLKTDIFPSNGEPSSSRHSATVGRPLRRKGTADDIHEQARASSSRAPKRVSEAKERKSRNRNGKDKKEEQNDDNSSDEDTYTS